MAETKHAELTARYGTTGPKLLAHLDRLKEFQESGVLRPITVQLAPTEACDSDCGYCSVKNRPQNRYLPLHAAYQLLKDFRELGARSLEITGGGNPLLYKDRELGGGINLLIYYAWMLDYKVGIITNSETLGKIGEDLHGKIDWIRISLAKLEEGKTAADYDLCGFPEEKVGFSWIIHDSMRPDLPYKVEQVAAKFPRARFVRAVHDCTKAARYEDSKRTWLPVLDQKPERFYLKETCDGTPYDSACFMGLVRPYVAAPPDGQGEYQVYACSSHVLRKQNYDRAYALCGVSEVLTAWPRMWEKMRSHGYPYEVNGNGGRGWGGTCGGVCFYRDNNRLLHDVSRKPADADFA